MADAPKTGTLEDPALAGTVQAELVNGAVSVVDGVDADVDLFIGQMVNGYEITRRMSDGGMGLIYAAGHAELGMECVIKILRPELTAEAQRFLDEAQVMSDLRKGGCAGIVQVSNFGRVEVGEARYPYIMMEMLNGCDLATEMDTQGALQWSRAVDIAAQVAETLASVHACNVVHRDLKPENIFLVQQKKAGDKAILLDFGVAKRLDSTATARTQAGLVVGTPYYMSPEQVEDPKKLDSRSDIFSLGAVLYHMLAGGRPFDGTSVMRVLTKILDEKEPPRLETVRSDVPVELANVVHRMLAKERDDRPASMTEVADLLVPFRPARTLTPASGSVSAAAQALKVDGVQTRRNWWKVLGLSALVMAVAALIVAGVVAFSDGNEKVVPSVVPATTAPVVADSAPKADAGRSADTTRDGGKTVAKPKLRKKPKAKRQVAPPAPATSGDPTHLPVR